jgi:hypothetical protein
MSASLPATAQALEMALAETLANAPERWAAAWGVRTRHHPPVLLLDRPSATRPVSLTGAACGLNCAHCGGFYLQHMQPIEALDVAGSKSLLISGGCDPQGRVPVTRHLETIAALKGKVRLNWHVGFIDDADLERIAPLVDVVSFDVVGDAETAREVYGLELTLADYMDTYDRLAARVPVVPHVTIGLRAGRLSGEITALEALAERHPAKLILIILIPTPGTAYADVPPPALGDVAEVLLAARELLPTTALHLGCMRPYGAYRRAVDELAVRAGINGIVNPSANVAALAAALGLTVIGRDECCAF